jgi:hypothetical protein
MEALGEPDPPSEHAPDAENALQDPAQVMITVLTDAAPEPALVRVRYDEEYEVEHVKVVVVPPARKCAA